MTMSPLLMIVPSRSRPQNIAPLVDAWLATGGFEAADLLVAIDRDDPTFEAYEQALIDAAIQVAAAGHTGLIAHTMPRHEQLVPKLNSVATLHAQYVPAHVLLGFGGDDHLPRTRGWSRSFVELFETDPKLGIAYPDDGYQGEKLASSWVMSADIVRELGRMVPADVEHLYCDNAVMDLGALAGCLCYVPGIEIEHVNPYAGKGELDEQYKRVNSHDQYRRDRPAYKRWKRDGGLALDADRVRALIDGRVSNA